jgi:hypothetical protein
MKIVDLCVRTVAKGDYYARFHQDPRRPGWTHSVGGI